MPAYLLTLVACNYETCSNVMGYETKATAGLAKPRSKPDRGSLKLG